MNALVAELKDNQQDFEWYPTTDEIIEAIKNDLENQKLDGKYSVLDCGAGDGRVLNALTEGRKYAIEKSKPLLNALDRKIFVVGTDFVEQTLIDKRVDVVFSNPPYSEFNAWMTKIILEARAKLLYLVVPKRWESDVVIKEAIKSRSAEAKVIKEADFLNAERQARAKVHVVRIDLQPNATRHSYYRRGGAKVDPFELWFNENFKIGAQNKQRSEHQKGTSKRESTKEQVQNALVSGGDIVAVLEELYNQDLSHLINNYRSLESLDSALLEELDVNLEGLREAFDLKITNLKDLYWRELFNNLSKVTERLTKKSRESLLNTLTEHTHVDFTVRNAHAILEWVIKNANHYLDDQLIELVEQMTEKASVVLYKSNEKTFGEEKWRYCRRPEGLEKYKLEYRVVLQSSGGIDTGYWGDKSEISNRAATLINDIRAVANNVGFDTRGLLEDPKAHFNWASNKKNVFHFKHPKTGDAVQLMEVKAFKNGNLHIKFNQAFMCKLNVEFGRLKGWLKTAEQAADEIDITLKAAQMSFKSQKLITASSLPALTLAKQ